MIYYKIPEVVRLTSRLVNCRTVVENLREAGNSGVFNHEKTAIILFLILCMLACTACNSNKDQQPGTVNAKELSPDIVVKCEVTGYSQYAAGHGSVNYPLLMGENVRLSVAADGYTLEWIY